MRGLRESAEAERVREQMIERTKVRITRITHKTMNDLMVDIETLGRRAGCVVFEIAAVEFEIDTLKPLREFRVSIDVEDSERNGLIICDETWAWWEEKGGICLDEPMMFEEAYLRFSRWVSQVKPVRVWSCGTCFERPILEHCFDVIGIPLPWHYGDGRDLRTAWDMAFPGLRREKASHRALEDCHQQIRELGLALEVRPMGKVPS